MQQLLIVSHVLPLPGISGQRQRVASIAKVLSETFAVDLLWVGPPLDTSTKHALQKTFRKILWVRPRVSLITRIWGHVRSRISKVRPSVFQLPAWVESSFPADAPLWRQYELILFEYVHYAPVSARLRQQGIRTACDLHNVLWWAHPPYRSYEEAAYEQFDLLIAINREEYHYLCRLGYPTLYCPMSIDVSTHPYVWHLSLNPPRFFYYGSLTSERNRKHIRFLRKVIIHLRSESTDAELHLAGEGTHSASTPHEGIISHGHVDNPTSLLSRMTLALLPWEGRYGFRSRALELAAGGVPIAASDDAFAGTDFIASHHYLSMPPPYDPRQWANALMNTLQNPQHLTRISHAARRLIIQQYSPQTVYSSFINALHRWMNASNR